MKTKLILKILLSWVIYLIGCVISIHYNSGIGITIFGLLLFVNIGITAILIENYKYKKKYKINDSIKV
jgi:hypothetical protein